MIYRLIIGCKALTNHNVYYYPLKADIAILPLQTASASTEHINDRVMQAVMHV